MIARYVIANMNLVSYPGVIFQVPLEDEKLYSLIKDKKVTRVVIAYMKENDVLIDVALYAKPLKVEKDPKSSKMILEFEGLREISIHNFASRYIDKDMLSALKEEDQKQIKEITKNEGQEALNEYFECGEISEINAFEQNLSLFTKDKTMVSLIEDGYRSLEMADESPLIKHPFENTEYRVSKILQMQNKTSLSEDLKIKTLLSFTTDGFFGFEKVEFLKSRDNEEIVKMLTLVIVKINKKLTLENEIVNEMTKSLNDHQKEFMLREKLKTIQSKLDEIDNNQDDFDKQINDPVLNKIYPDSVKTLIEKETARFKQMVPSSPDANLTKTYVDNLKQLPWRKTEKDFLDFDQVKTILDKYHYGLEQVKERIVEYIAVMVNNKKHQKLDKDSLISIDDKYQIDMDLFKENERENKTFNNVPILTLVGPPGTGKTSLSKAIAEALNKKFLKISLGGVHDEAEIRGHRRTYVGAMPGKIIKGIMKAEISNPLILLDEIDKMASDMKGDPASAMLEVLDPEQNANFQDHYLEHEYDLSKVVFIATANSFEDIPAPLIDRVEIIELSPYTVTEKVKIARNHLIPKVLEQVSLNQAMLKIDDETLIYIIRHYTLEAGVRGLKRILDKLARKIVVKYIENPKMKSFSVTISKLEDLLGVVKFKDDLKEELALPGVVNGLAYTSAGGSTLEIEVTSYAGKGEIKLTGQLKDVMQESAQIALTYVRSNAEKYGIKDFDFENQTIHIHVPEGAVPKDGPSAGVTFTTAIISALSKRPVSTNYAMTGEITLRGKVLEIGGLKEKSFAATQKEIQNVFIPYGNKRNLRDIADEIKCQITYIPVKNYDEIYDVLFNNKKPKEVINTPKPELKD